MIHTLSIENFQAHAKLTIDLVRGVTTIVGSSDTGKSAILRALRWLVFNRPGGEAFLRDGTDTVKVTVETDNDEITRIKGKAGNTYHLNGQEFKAFGADVPEAVQRSLNLAEINFQGQHDAPFWFSNTAGEVSRALNGVINLGGMDNTLAYLNGRIRAGNAKVTVCMERWAKAKGDRRLLVPVLRMDEELKEVEELNRIFRWLFVQRDFLTLVVQELKQHEKTIEDVHKFGARVQRVVALGDRWVELGGQCDSLMKLACQLQRYTRIVETGIPDLSELEGRANKLQELTERGRVLKELSFELKCASQRLAVATSQKQLHEQQLATEIGKVCPLCGQSTTKK